MKDATLLLVLLLCSSVTSAQEGAQSAPMAISTPEPEYSQTARAANVEGACLLSLVVGQDGHTHDIQVSRSLEPTLDEKAVEAVKNWTFKPAMKDGLPVAVRITVEVSFHTDRLLSSEILRGEIGDLGIKSDAIAYSHDALEVLRQRGSRRYYEVALETGKPVAVSTVTLQLWNSDPKHGKFSLRVTADHTTIQKNHRNIREPIQFYSGGSLYEVVIWNVDKDNATGYLSAPKNSP